MSSRQEQRVEVHAEQEISQRRSLQRVEQHVEHQTSRVLKIITRYIRIDK